MRHPSVILTASLAAFSAALPASTPYALHEKRSTVSWTRNNVRRPDGGTILPVRIGLTQSNLEDGYDLLMKVADPRSQSYGQHWTVDQIVEKFRPAEESIDAVFQWLGSSGIDVARSSLSPGKNWIKFSATVSEMEALLHTQYRFYTHNLTGQPHLACDEYSLPEYLRHHIDLIMPTVHFDVKLDPEYEKKIKKRKVYPGNPGNGFQPKQGRVIKGPGSPSPNAAQPAVQFNLTNCNQYITPDCLRALYNIPNGTLDQSSFGVVEYTPQAYLQSDLDLFYENLQRQIPTGTAPTFDSVDGGVAQTNGTGFGFNGESDLDLEYAFALVYPQEVTLYQVGDLEQGASFNNFLDAIDGSYCTYEGGDDLTQDGIYPDPLPGGYFSKDCGRYTPTSVISTSYGYNEADLLATYEQRQCNEYMKLGLAGVSVLYSSGDYGVAGNGGTCCLLPGCAGGRTSSAGKTFNPSFPGGCPYVTSVGATQIAPNATVTDPETACETVILSGGGFSNVFALPDYQADAVTTFLTEHPPPYNASQYNNSGRVRAFPDISANGANYVVAVDGSLTLVYGTSASTPTFGSIITLINEQRAVAGKDSLGFLNPALYQNPDAFNDITIGGNQGCGTPGFSSVEGWDPVTGLGTPDYVKLEAALLALP